MAFSVGGIGLFTQALLFRELSIVLRSNDLIVGLLLASWLVFAGIGSLSGLLRGRWHSALLLQAGLAIVSVVWCHLLTLLLAPKMGEIWPFPLTVLLVAASVGPVAFLTGTAFSALARKYSEFGNPAKVYIFEGFGALAGGVLSLILVPVLAPKIGIPLIVALALAGVLPFTASRKNRLLVGVACIVAFVLLPILNLTDSCIYNAMRPGYTVERYESAWGAIEILHRHEEVYLFQSGSYAGSTGDSVLAEGIVHPIMLKAQRKKNILVMGGVLQGAVESALLYEPDDVTVLVADPKLLAVGSAKFARFRQLSDQRIDVLTGDPKRSIARLGGEYDVAIFFSEIPQSGASGRLLTVSAFRELSEKMAPNGIVAVGFPVSPNIVTEEEAAVLASVGEAMRSVFGSSRVYLVSSVAMVVAPDDGELGDFIRAGDYEPPPTKRLPKPILANLFEEYRQRDLAERINSASVPANTDDRPVAFLVGIKHWERLTGGGLVRILSERPFIFWAAPLLFLVIFGVLLRVVHRLGKVSAPFAAISMGGIGMGLSVLGLYGFQLAVGQLYAAIGLLSALFLTGTVIGAQLSSINRLNVSRWRILLLLLFPISLGIIRLPGLTPPLGLAIPIYGLFHLYAGFVVGALYPLLLQQAEAQNLWRNRVAGVIYGFDLIGAALSAPVFGVILIPSLGVEKALILLTILIIFTAVVVKQSKSGGIR